jgi:hypothetical protein
MYQQLWGYKVEDKLYLGVSEQKRLNTTGLDKHEFRCMDLVSQRCANTSLIGTRLTAVSREVCDLYIQSSTKQGRSTCSS